MTTADPATGIERLNTLITPDLWKEVDGTNLAAVVGWGTMLNVAHLVRGVCTLHAADQCHAAFPLLRSVMEYTLGTMWLAEKGEDAVSVLNRKLKGSHSKLLADLGDLDLDASFPPEAVRSFRGVLAAEIPPHPDERLSAFRHLMEEYGFEKMIPMYNVLSGDRAPVARGRSAVLPEYGRRDRPLAGASHSRGSTMRGDLPGNAVRHDAQLQRAAVF